MTVAQAPLSTLEEEIRTGVYICQCGLNIADAVDCEDVAVWEKNLEGVILYWDYL